MPRAVVFAYHNVGVRCLRVLLAHGVDVALVVTHADNPFETIWFRSVATAARRMRDRDDRADTPNTPDLVDRIEALAPDFLFSFYYREMLAAPLLATARRGALNMHGSLLPRYRGRAPVNWAILHGERETGATLHYMTEKPTQATSSRRPRADPARRHGARRVRQDHRRRGDRARRRAAGAHQRHGRRAGRRIRSSGSYFGGRQPEDGIIDWRRDAASIHNLVRAVAPPYPAHGPRWPGMPARVLRTRVADPSAPSTSTPSVDVRDGRLSRAAVAAGRSRSWLWRLAGAACDASALTARFGAAQVPLGTARTRPAPTYNRACAKS